LTILARVIEKEIRAKWYW